MNIQNDNGTYKNEGLKRDELGAVVGKSEGGISKISKCLPGGECLYPHDPKDPDNKFLLIPRIKLCDETKNTLIQLAQIEADNNNKHYEVWIWNIVDDKNCNFDIVEVGSEAINKKSPYNIHLQTVSPKNIQGN